MLLVLTLFTLVLSHRKTIQVMLFLSGAIDAVERWRSPGRGTNTGNNRTCFLGYNQQSMRRSGVYFLW